MSKSSPCAMRTRTDHYRHVAAKTSSSRSNKGNRISRSRYSRPCMVAGTGFEGTWEGWSTRLNLTPAGARIISNRPYPAGRSPLGAGARKQTVNPPAQAVKPRAQPVSAMFCRPSQPLFPRLPPLDGARPRLHISLARANVKDPRRIVKTAGGSAPKRHANAAIQLAFQPVP